jgi:inosine-uridine nucleoside N-ribohydrolase
MNTRLITLYCLFVLCVAVPHAATAQSLERVAALIDTDLGTDIDDAFALGLAFGSHELDVRGITTVGDDTQQRAMMVCRFLTVTGRRHTAVAAGNKPQPKRAITEQYKYYHHPDVLFDRTKKPERQFAVEFLVARLHPPQKVTLVALGPLTNVAHLLDANAKAASQVASVILLEANIKLDIPAAKKVFAAGLPLVVLGADACVGLTLNDREVQAIFSPGTPLTRQVQTLFQMWNRPNPPVAEALAVAMCFEHRFTDSVLKSLSVDDQGQLNETGGNSNAKLVTSVRADDFKNWYTRRMASLVSPASRPVTLVEQGGMPHRVHVAEDYDNDIERQWWMSGRPETRLLPAGSKRACRSVLTHDFDDLLMASREMYSAVIFNPVPGPPMGKNTRLGFRYWLKGTDTIRVQIYSLSNGYHRQLVVHGLPQQKWQQATVDITQARRADGTGGPLSEGERIDDIQFYIDPDAEVIIDDVVLYDAARDGEKLPFPKRIIFTGWFDTGAHGREWPGDFKLAADAGNFWRAAQSVENSATGQPWLRVGLRGQRALGERSALSFRYRLSGADAIQIRLVNSATGASQSAEAKSLEQGNWADATVDFDTKGLPSADEIHLLLPKGGALLLDDLLLFEPGG